MNPKLFASTCQAVWFINQHYPPSHNWKDSFGYCAWYIAHGYMALVIDRENRIVGLCTARPVMQPGEGAWPYCHDPEGSCIFIDLLLVPKNFDVIVQGLRLTLQERFGHRDKVAYFRGTEKKMRIHSYDIFQKNVARVTREQRESQIVNTQHTTST